MLNIYPVVFSVAQADKYSPRPTPKNADPNPESIPLIKILAITKFLFLNSQKFAKDLDNESASLNSFLYLSNEY